MNIKVVATAGNGSFIARDHEHAYYVLTLDDSREIECGDVLAGNFDGHGSLFYSVRNESKGENVRICLENWESPLEPAIKMVLNFMKGRAGKIIVGGAAMASDAPDVAGRLYEAIKRAE
jgi:hypothetical protein